VANDLDVYNIFDPSIRPDPYPVYRRLRDEHRVLANPVLGFWMVTGYEETVAALREPGVFSSGQIGIDPIRDVLRAPTMLFTDPPDHERLRSVVARAFSPKSVKDLAPRVREITDELLEPLASGSGYDAVADLAYPLPVIVIAEMLGVPAEDRDMFKRWSDAVIGFNALGDPEAQARAQRECQELYDYFSAVIAERRKRPGDDLVSRLVLANEDGTVTDDELLASCVLLLVAGNETTTNLISNALLALARHPDQWRRVVDDRSLIPNAVEEILRFDAPVQSSLRVTTEETSLGRATIPAGTMVLVMMAAANRDPGQFPDPDRFDVGRANAGRNIAFGHGIHHCIGAALARLEGRVVLERLAALAPKFALAAPGQPLEYGPSFFLRGPTELRLVTAGL
jgi:cytochrome P450